MFFTMSKLSKLKLRRLTIGKKVLDIAIHAGVSRSYIYMVEGGFLPDPETLKKLAFEYGISIAEFKRMHSQLVQKEQI